MVNCCPIHGPWIIFCLGISAIPSKQLYLVLFLSVFPCKHIVDHRTSQLVHLFHRTRTVHLYPFSVFSIKIFPHLPLPLCLVHCSAQSQASYQSCKFLQFGISPPCLCQKYSRTESFLDALHIVVFPSTRLCPFQQPLEHHLFRRREINDHRRQADLKRN